MTHHTEAEKRLGVRIHAVAYLATVLLLVAVNVLTGSPYWVVWVIPPLTLASCVTGTSFWAAACTERESAREHMRRTA